MTPHFNLDIALYERYLAGELFPAEADRVRQLLDESPRLRDGLIALQAAAATSASPFDTARVAREVMAGRGRSVQAEPGNVENDFPRQSRIKKPATSNEGGAAPARRQAGGHLLQPDPTHAVRWVRWGVMASALALAFMCGVWIKPSSLATPASRVYIAGVGQQQTVTLDDGTRVTLTPTSVLRVPEFRGQQRQVELTGEAHFDVTHTKGAPFTVQAGHINTVVLGTEFTVRKYPTDNSVRVAVASGKIAVSSQTSRRHPTILIAGDVGTMTDSSTTVVASSELGPYMGWINGRLIFRNTPIREVLATLGRWYGYEFTLTDSLLIRDTLTAVFSTESSASALATLQLLLHADLVIEGKTVILTPRLIRGPSAPARRQWNGTPSILYTRGGSQ